MKSDEINLLTLNISSDRRKNVIFITVSGPVNAAQSPRLREAIGEAFKKEVQAVIIDMNGVDYMDSSGLATFVEAVQKAEERGAKFAILGNMHERIQHLFEITRLDGLFLRFQSKEEVLNTIMNDE
ncbi:MAG: STAS domain-containing protein [Candidatus Omnitrophota bacterium]